MKDAADAILKPEQAAYLEGIESPRDALLVEMEAYAKEKHQPISDPEVASFLAITARLAHPKTIVEVGANIGYGAIVLARAATDAKVITIENDPETAKVARGFIERSGLTNRIEVRESDALAALAVLTGEIDLVYIDCVKEHYPAYLDLVLPKLSARGIIIADNVLWRGLVASTKELPASEVGRVTALRTFNHTITTDARLRGVILPLGDGLAYAVRV